MSNSPLETNAGNLIIQGVREDNRKFRPSDWAERISATLAVFGRDQKLRYSNYAQPCMIQDQKCLVLARGLEETDFQAYKFIMDFARANQLRIQEDRRYEERPVDEDRRSDACQRCVSSQR